ncbi:ankyrin repeat protein SKIP35-like [Pyrus ussuriensis x Pyrus communis]|uniref:Ankyrin repeat protein SKIP35-like n=1 Tax=Pyrus ussuriensis x Pyrus communis TaxID=2448454 RepID=A0A5N5HKN3_9ROSA|nr:ankyrin repeat protein SKIP35-like [Pyrus ussuriensis x Pyrus communis]
MTIPTQVSLLIHTENIMIPNTQYKEFKTFIDLAGNELTSDDFGMVLSLLFFSCSSGPDPGIWATTAIPGLLGMRTTTLSMGV